MRYRFFTETKIPYPDPANPSVERFEVLIRARSLREAVETGVSIEEAVELLCEVKR